MENKIILFEIEKDNVPDLTWTQTDATHNIWTTPYVTSDNKDVTSLTDSTKNGYYRVSSTSDLPKNIVKLNNQDLEIPDSATSASLVASDIRGRSYPGWTTGGTAANVTFTSDTNRPEDNWTVSCPANNLQLSVTKTQSGRVPSIATTEEIKVEQPIFPSNWSDEYIAKWNSYEANHYVLDVVIDGAGYTTGVNVVAQVGTLTPNSSIDITEKLWDQTRPEYRSSSAVVKMHAHLVTNSSGVITSVVIDTVGRYDVISESLRYYVDEPSNFTYNFKLIVRDMILPLTGGYDDGSDPLLPLKNFYGEIRAWAFASGENPDAIKSFLWQRRNAFPQYYLLDYDLNITPAAQELIDQWKQFRTIYQVVTPYNPYDYVVFRSLANKKYEGAIGFVDIKASGVTCNIHCTREGGEVTDAGQPTILTLSVSSYSTNYRLYHYANQVLTGRFPYGVNPSSYTFSSYLKKGFSNYEGYYDGLFYEGKIISIPTISYKKDSTYYSIVSFDGGTVTLNNTEGYFDNLDEEDVYGQRVTLRYSSDSGVSFQTIYTGYFESYQLNGIPGQCVVNVYDKRKILSKSLPNNYYKISNYPFLNTQNDGLPIALGFGKIHRAQAICLNEAETPIPTNYTFKICDSIYPINALTQVYYEGDPVTAENIDLTNCTFTLPSSVYTAGKMVTMTYEGYVVDGSLLENPIKILELLLDRYAGFAKNSFNYNLVEWNSCRDKPGLPRIGYHIAETKKTMIDVIGEISNSVFGSFLIQKDGLISFKIRDVTKSITEYIRVDDQISAPVQNYISSEYANSLRVGYQKAFSTGKSTHERFDSKEEELFNKYRVDFEKTVETIISNKADALIYGNSLYQEFAGIFPTFSITTKSRFFGLELEDLIEVEVYKLPDGSYGTVVLEVLGVDSDLNTNVVIITGRFVRYGGTYTGKKLIKFIST